MTIQKLEEKVHPLTEISKINEIIEEVDAACAFSTTNSKALVPVNGICTWDIAHNLNSSEILCSLFINNTEVVKSSTALTLNTLRITFNSLETKVIGSCRVVLLAKGSSSGISKVYDSTVTFMQGGEEKGSFTLNQAQDETITLDMGAPYTLPVATTSTLGGVKVDGNSLNVTNQVLEANTYPKIYFASGLIVDAPNSTLAGYGVATVVLFSSGLAKIDFALKGEVNGTVSQGMWGLNRDLLRSINSNIPVITPINSTGYYLAYDSYYYCLYIPYTGYGTFFIKNGDNYWTPAHVGGTQGSISVMSNLGKNNTIRGVAYGTYQVGTEG